MNGEISAVIVEDSKEHCDPLKRLLQNEFPDVDVQGEAGDIDKAYEVVTQTKPDLVFLNIQLKNHTAFDLLDQLIKNNSVNFEVIFITSHGSFEDATKAISYSALDFITKPINSNSLQKAVAKARERLDRDNYKEHILMLLEKISTPHSHVNRIAVHMTKGVIELLPVDEIIYLEADRSITYIYLTEDRKFNAMRNLGHYSTLLVSDHTFYPISNKIVVNLDYVLRYNHSNLTVTLTNDKKIRASRRGGQEFRRFLNNQEGFHGKIDKNWWDRLFG